MSNNNTSGKSNPDKENDISKLRMEISNDKKSFWYQENDLMCMASGKSPNLIHLIESEYSDDDDDAVGELDRFVFLQGGTKAFSFRKSIKKGTYVLPFSFKLPDNIPGTLHAMTKGSKDIHQLTKIGYTVEVFVAGYRKRLSKTHEFQVREFTFTKQEIAVDVLNQAEQSKVLDLFKITNNLKPMFSSDRKLGTATKH
jgi:hypothetical protein